MTALMLTAAISSEVVATLALKASDGFSRPGPIALVVIGYAVSFTLLAHVLKHLSVGTTYAIWSAVGTAAIALIGIALYGDGAPALKLDAVAAQAGVSKGGLLYHFKTKRELVQAMIERWLQEFQGDIEAADEHFVRGYVKASAPAEN